MKRREFIPVLGGAATWPLPVRSQRATCILMLGILMPRIEHDRDRQMRLAAFRTELVRLGWSEGNNLRIEIRWGGEDPALFVR
jgi:putative tryptophan/tyrosine transport system substrate-binding protein